MFRWLLVAAVVSLALIASAPAATLGPTSPMRPVYPHVHLNSPLNSHIVPRAGRDPWATDDCVSHARGKRRIRKRDCRLNGRD